MPKGRGSRTAIRGGSSRLSYRDLSTRRYNLRDLVRDPMISPLAESLRQTILSDDLTIVGTGKPRPAQGLTEPRCRLSQERFRTRPALIEPGCIEGIAFDEARKPCRVEIPLRARPIWKPMPTPRERLLRIGPGLMHNWLKRVCRVLNSTTLVPAPAA
jgi:hypothetical protein